MKKTLSVVIPSYNVEKFLDQTLSSFVDSSILDEIEVLIVDDGSKDGTAEKGKEFENRYPESFRVISKENGGHGSTINKGIEECTGEFFKVVDGDDWVDTEEFISLVKKLKSCDADCVVTNFYEVDDQTGEKIKKDFSKLKNKGQEGYWRFADLAGDTQIPMHAIVFKSSILKEHNIRLDENRFYVDVEYILYPIPFVHTVAYYDLYVYMYRVAQATQSVSMEGYRKHIQDHIDVTLHLVEFAEKYRKTAAANEREKVKYIGERIAAMVGSQAAIFRSYPVSDVGNREKFIAFDNELKDKSEWLYDLSSKKSKLLAILRKFSFRGYKVIIRASQIKRGL